MSKIRNSVSIDFIQGKSADKVLHIFWKKWRIRKKKTKSEKFVFLSFDKLFHYKNGVRDR